ncbi:MAG TPA: class I SAM-dependent methyltransferase [Candidatus Lokiarchaeia archaeon]|nr:class I SAM-dependent methyltransferase [Candidatus Lokiarchaeia archaeon]
MTTDSKKPNYGYVAAKYFVNIGVIGGICIGIAMICWFFLRGTLAIVLFLGFLIFGAACAWIAANYIPLHLMMMRKGAPTNHWQEIIEGEGLIEEFNVLDVGCGTGRAAIDVARSFPKAQVVGIDIFQGASGNSPEQAQHNAELEGVGDRVVIKEGNLLQIPYPDESFDVVTSSSVLHDVHGTSDKKKAVQEITRVLKPGGFVVALELFRDWRMWTSLLFFAMAWNPERFWHELLDDGALQLVNVKKHARFLNYGVFIAKKT